MNDAFTAFELIVLMISMAGRFPSIQSSGQLLEREDQPFALQNWHEDIHRTEKLLLTRLRTMQAVLRSFRLRSGDPPSPELRDQHRAFHLCCNFDGTLPVLYCRLTRLGMGCSSGTLAAALPGPPHGP